MERENVLFMANKRVLCGKYFRKNYVGSNELEVFTHKWTGPNEKKKKKIIFLLFVKHSKQIFAHNAM